MEDTLETTEIIETDNILVDNEDTKIVVDNEGVIKEEVKDVPVDIKEVKNGISDEDFLSKYNEIHKTDHKSINELKKLTEEEVQQAQTQEEKELITHFLENGGKLDDFYNIKKLANANPELLHKANKLQEYTAAGFSNEEAETLYKKNYSYEVDEFEEDTEILAEQKKIKDFIENKKKTSTLYQIEEAKNYLKHLEAKKEALKQERLLEESVVNKANDVLNTLTKLKVDTGKSNEEVRPVIDYIFSEQQKTAVKNILSNREKRDEFLYNQDGTEKVENLAEMMLVYKAYQDGTLQTKIADAIQNFEVEKLQKIGLPSNWKSLANTSTNESNSGFKKGEFIPSHLVKN